MKRISILICLFSVYAFAQKTKNPTYVEMAQTENGSVGAFFPFDWMLTAALSSPVVMLLLWIFKEWWDEHKGWKKEVKDDMKWLRDNFNRMEAKVGEDIDEKIERKISNAFELFAKGKGH